MTIVTRQPSNLANYDAFWSGDPAFVQADDDEHQRKLELARETGDWSSLLIAGLVPTKFVMRQIPGHVKRRVLDQYNAKMIGGHELDALLVRLAVVQVVGLGDFKLRTVSDALYGKLADVELIDILDDSAAGSVSELAVQVFHRMMGLSGK